MHTCEQPEVHGADPQGQVADHIGACRRRIGPFVKANYAWPGAIGLNRRAWGIDVLVAPLNFLMGFPNFVLRLLAAFLDLLRARGAAKRLARIHLGFPTRVQKTLAVRLWEDLLGLSANQQDAPDSVRGLIALAAREPVRIYLQTRNVAADITAGTLAVVTGILFFHQFTPGSISAGSAVASLLAREQAVSEFALGETFGRLYYALFPVSPSPATLVLALLLVMSTVAVVAAFSGFVQDPIQALTGVHRRRLSRLLDAIEESSKHSVGKGYRPKDTYVGRVYDLMDWIKGLLSF